MWTVLQHLKQADVKTRHIALQRSIEKIQRSMREESAYHLHGGSKKY